MAQGIHFGALAGWEPGREGKRINLTLRNEAGVIEVVSGGVCYLCHDGLTTARMPDSVVCGACGRYAGDPLIERALEADPGPAADTPAERKDWELKPVAERYPARRIIPEKYPRKRLAPVAEPRHQEPPP